MAKKTEKTDKKQTTDKPWLFKPGQSGNPTGRPPGSISIITGIKQMLAEVDPGNKKTYLEQVIKKIMDKALIDGEDSMLKLLVSYIDGLPRQPIDLGVDREGLQELTEYMRALAKPTQNDSTGQKGV